MALPVHIAGAAVADLSQPILPGADITNKDLPDGPKPGNALKDVGSGNIADKVVAWPLHSFAMYPAVCPHCTLLLL